MKVASIYSYAKIGNTDELFRYLDELMFKKAKENNVEFEINVLNEIKEIKIHDRDLCEIAGILIDNAIEAAAESFERMVSISISEVDGEVLIIVKNSTDQKIDISKITQKGWSTKGEGRGLARLTHENLFIERILYKNFKIMPFRHQFI